MNGIHPSLKIILAFVISSFITFMGINAVISEVGRREQLAHTEAANILQQEISERFNLILDGTLVIGQMSSKYLFSQNKTDHRDEELLQKVLKERDYIIGINRINASGKIIATYPLEGNERAIDKVSQNFSEISKSYSRGEKHWFSPPTELFQGGIGFVFYIPLEENQKLVGWIAPVISFKPFFKHFRTLSFFKEYDLIIKDELTGRIYFETGLPGETDKLQETKSKIQQRNIIFLSWPKTDVGGVSLSPSLVFIICLASGFFFALMMKIYLQKKKAFSRLENISDLLKLTSNEALTNLLDIQSKYLSIGSTGFLSTEVVENDVQSVTNLMEQLELLQSMAMSEQIGEDRFEVLPLLSEQLEVIRDVTAKKKLDFKVDTDSFIGVKITGNRWLISNTVIKNTLSYIALIACPRSRVEVSHTITTKECTTIFQIDKVYDEEELKALRIERRLLVARNVMDLLKGEIIIYKDGAGGMFLKLTMPITS